MLARDAANDSLVLRPGLSLDTIRAARGKGFMIGTNAVRRAAYLRRLFPEATVIHYRGAADTRIAKLDRGAKQRLPDGGEVGPADALVMARSGLERIGMTARIAHDFSVDEMLPAVGQGVVAVECVETDWATRARLGRIDNAPSRIAAEAEREVLWVLNGHCNSPVAGFSTIAGDQMSLTASVLDLSGNTIIEASHTGPANRPRELGRAVGLELLTKGAAEIIERSRPR
jgi:hydroxymethylbilane synthase